MAVLPSLIIILAGTVCARALREGEDLVFELADEVLANPEAILDIPWDMFQGKALDTTPRRFINTPSYRDVGYVGEHPIADSAVLEVKVGSLQTPRELEGHSPLICIGRVLTKGSNKPAQPPPDYRITGVGGAEVRRLNGLTNPTADLTVWQWQKNKWTAAKEWMEYWQDRGKSNNKLAIIHSSGDVLYGGCEENIMIYKYNKILADSGGVQKIVLGAELSPFPSAVGYAYNRTAWIDTLKAGVNSGSGIPDDWASAYADCTNPKYGPCTSPPAYKFADSGFMMGPLDALLPMVSEIAGSFSGSNDNQLFNEYLLKHPDKVTVDYAGSLSMSINNMKPKHLPLEIASTRAGGKVIKSKVTGNTVCFVRGSGGSFGTLKGLAKMVKA